MQHAVRLTRLAMRNVTVSRNRQTSARKRRRESRWPDMGAAALLAAGEELHCRSRQGAFHVMHLWHDVVQPVRLLMRKSVSVIRFQSTLHSSHGGDRRKRQALWPWQVKPRTRRGSGHPQPRHRSADLGTGRVCEPHGTGHGTCIKDPGRRQGRAGTLGSCSRHVGRPNESRAIAMEPCSTHGGREISLGLGDLVSGAFSNSRHQVCCPMKCNSILSEAPKNMATTQAVVIPGTTALWPSLFVQLALDSMPLQKRSLRFSIAGLGGHGQGYLQVDIKVHTMGLANPQAPDQATGSGMH